MILARETLRKILGVLSKWALRKHSIELVVITGWYGTEIAREMLYTIFAEKIRTRRNTRSLWWDFSIPLAILGYKDKKRNFFQWLILIIKAFAYLLLGKANPHTLILNADSSDENIAAYWASFLTPDYLIILNDKNSTVVKHLIKTTDKDKSLIIYNPEIISKSTAKKLKKQRTYTFGGDKQADLVIKTHKRKTTIKTKTKSAELPLSSLPTFSKDILGGIYSLALLKDLEIEEISYNALKFELPNDIVAKIKSNLELTSLQ